MRISLWLSGEGCLCTVLAQNVISSFANVFVEAERAGRSVQSPGLGCSWVYGHSITDTHCHLGLASRYRGLVQCDHSGQDRAPYRTSPRNLNYNGQPRSTLSFSYTRLQTRNLLASRHLAAHGHYTRPVRPERRPRRSSWFSPVFTDGPLQPIHAVLLHVQPRGSVVHPLHGLILEAA